jgi:prepilin peptidase CpaA
VTWPAPQLLGDVLLGVFCLVAVITDVRTHRIPNAWTFGFMALGLGLAAAGKTPAPIAEAGLGLGLGFLVLFPFFAAGGIGAGDVKMLMAIGALAGWKFLAVTCLAAGLCGGALSFLVAFYDIRRLGGWVQYMMITKKEMKERTSRAESIRTKMPYGVAIAAGVLWTRLAPLARL